MMITDYKFYAAMVVPLFSLLACAPVKVEDSVTTLNKSHQICKVFSMKGIKVTTIRASEVYRSNVERIKTGDNLRICGKVNISPFSFHSKGMHYTSFNLKEPDYGLGFQGKRYGNMLIISTQGEIRAIHHTHVLSDLKIRLPRDVKITYEKRRLPIRNLKPYLLLK